MLPLSLTLRGSTLKALPGLGLPGLLRGMVPLPGGVPETGAPVVTSAFVWSASPSAPVIGVVVPTVTTAFTWAASPSAPVIGVVVPTVQSAFAWSSANVTPIFSTIAPTVATTFLWQAAAVTPVIESTVRVESIGSYNLAGYDQRVRIVRASRRWVAGASKPRITRPVFAVAAPSIVARRAWLAAAQMPRGVLLQRDAPIPTLERSSTTERVQLIRSAPFTLERSR